MRAGACCADEPVRHQRQHQQTLPPGRPGGPHFRDQEQQRHAGQQVMPFGMGFGGDMDPFASFFNHFNQLANSGMGQGFGQSFGSSQQGTCYSYSSTYSSSTGPNGVVYEQSSSTRRGPGGVRSDNVLTPSCADVAARTPCWTVCCQDKVACPMRAGHERACSNPARSPRVVSRQQAPASGVLHIDSA